MKKNQHWRIFAYSLGYFFLSTIPAVALASKPPHLLKLSQTPLSLNSAEKASVLIILDDSGSMHDDANGVAVGGASPKSKSEIARKATKSLIDDYTGKINMGLMAYKQKGVSKVDLYNFQTMEVVSQSWSTSTPSGGGYLHVPIKALNDGQVGALKKKLATSQFDKNGPTNPRLPLQNAGGTPMEGTLMTAKKYFSGVGLSESEGGPVKPLPESCGKNFVVLLTDGEPTVTPEGVYLWPSNTEGRAQAIPGVATAAASLLNKDGDKEDQVETYVIGFASTGALRDGLDSVAKAGGTEESHTAGNPKELKATFDNIFTDILNKTGASSSVATNSTALSTNSYVYQARFNSGDWSGRLFAKALGLDLKVKDTPTWDAADVLNSTAAASRVIITSDRDNGEGIPFSWTDISEQIDTTEKDQLNTNALGNKDGLGANRVNFLRGGDGGSSAASFRSDRVGKLGDIIHSTPYYVGAPTAGYNDVEMPGYSTFQANHKNRTPVLYVGANDGMMHGFSADSGKELLAYVPKSVFGNLSKLTAEGYGHAVPHQYFVDGAPMIADAYVDGGWKTVLAGGLNAGGQGVYALNITNPDQFSEANAAAIALWEFTDEDDSDLGYTFEQPADNLLTHQSAQIAKMANGKWAVIIGNGYNNTEADGHASSTGHAYLYILFIDGGIDGTWTAGSDYIKIDTGRGSTPIPNGLATPTPVDTDGDGDIDIIYAGDLQGNMWKFDVSSSNTQDWGSSITRTDKDTGAVKPRPLFNAKDRVGDGAKVQPITSAPLVTPHPRGGYMVSFGTGQYLQLSDTSTKQTQTIYGVWDRGYHIPRGRGTLAEQKVLATVHEENTDDDYRITSANPVDYTTKNGWYIDLPETGERVDLNGVIRNQRFVFVTRTPSSTACSAGGSSWIMDLDYLTGSRVDVSPFDVNGDGLINDADFITTTINGKQVTVPSTGYRSGSGGMVAIPTVVKTSKAKQEVKILANSDGNIKAIAESAETPNKGRVSWSELK